MCKMVMACVLRVTVLLWLTEATIHSLLLLLRLFCKGSFREEPYLCVVFWQKGPEKVAAAVQDNM